MKWKPAFFALLLATLLGLTTGASLMAQTQGLLPPSFGSWTAPAPPTQVSAGAESPNLPAIKPPFFTSTASPVPSAGTMRRAEYR